MKRYSPGALVVSIIVLVPGCVRFGICSGDGVCKKGEVCGTDGFCLPDGAAAGSDGGADRCPASASSLREQVPVIARIEPEVWCQGQDTALIRVVGDYLNSSDGQAAELSMEGQRWPLAFDGYPPIEAEGGVERHEGAELQIGTSDLGTLTPGEGSVTVANRDPAGPLCASAPFPVVISPSPVVDELPRQVCKDDGGVAVVTITGSDLFLAPDTMSRAKLELPLPGGTVLAADLQPGVGCSELASGWRHGCDTLEATLDLGAVPVGSYPAMLMGFSPSTFTGGCPSELPAGTIEVVDSKPTVLDPLPLFCEGAPLNINGSGFMPGLEAFLASDRTSERLRLIVEEVRPSRVVVRIPPGATLPTGAHLFLGSGSGCLRDAGAINPGMENPGFFLDPYVIPAGVVLKMKAYFERGIADNVRIQAGATTLDSSAFAPMIATESGYAELKAIVPGAGTYSVEVTGSGICPARFDAPLQVIGAATTTLVPTAFPGVLSNAVARRFSFQLSSGLSDAPWVFLKAQNPSFEESYLLEGAVWRGDAGGGTVEVTLPGPDASGNPTIPAGSYELCVIDPDGRYGCSGSNLTISSSVPPQIDGVFPPAPALNTNGNTQLTILGTGIDLASSPTVTLECVDGNGNKRAFSGVVSSRPTGDGLDVSFTGIASCRDQRSILRVTTDGGEVSWSPIVPRDAVRSDFGGNTKAGYIPNGTVTEGRRGLGAALLRYDARRRFLFFFGGKRSLAPQLLQDGYGVEVDEAGALIGSPSAISDLPKLLSHFGVATFGRYIYVAGGEMPDPGNGPASASLLRAKLLDRADAPRLIGYRVKATTGTGVTAQTQLYAVTGKFSQDDLDNPSGQGLSSDPLTLHLPQALTTPVQVELLFSPVRDAGERSLDKNGEAYWLYRAAAASPDAWSEVNRAGPTEPQVDAGTAGSAAAPPKPGTLGGWVTITDLIDPLNTAQYYRRVSPTLVATDSPTCGSSGCVTLVLFGGQTGAAATTATNDIVRVRIELGVTGRHLGILNREGALPFAILGNPGPYFLAASGLQTAVFQGPRLDLGFNVRRAFIYLAGGHAGTAAIDQAQVFEIDETGSPSMRAVVPTNAGADLERRASGAAVATGRRLLWLGGVNLGTAVGVESTEISSSLLAPASLNAGIAASGPGVGVSEFGFGSDGVDGFLVGGNASVLGSPADTREIIHVTY